VSVLDLTDPGTLLDLLRRHGFHTRKGLGQHFLVSSRALKAIVAACGSDLPVLEIGPGPGTVTRALAEARIPVTAIELDDRALPLLKETVGAFPHVRIVHGDILTIDLATVLGEQHWAAVGNLPYYITTPVVTRLLEHAERFARIILLVQREVADRMAAAPGTPAYGSLSVHVQATAVVERVAQVPNTAFLPPPTVQSSVILLTPHATPPVPPALRATFNRVVRAAFGLRRKTLENSLAGCGILDGDRPAVSKALHAADIPLGVRGETLGIPEFLRIAEVVSAREAE
jgi:16S rRNA (adenine1518-N6/adenine1519-N6)-dimethyltransferase